MLTRISIIAIIVALILGGAFWFGFSWDNADEERARADTLERIGDADVGEGDADDDRSWLDDFLGRVPEAD